MPTFITLATLDLVEVGGLIAIGGFVARFTKLELAQDGSKKPKER